MIRRRVARLAFVLLCSAPLPALADVTAHYTLGGKEALTVEVDDGGNARLGVDGKFSLITRDGVDYVAIMMKGQVLVVRYADLIALAKVKIKFDSGAQSADEAKAFVLASGAAAEIAGHKGTTWTFGLKDASPAAHMLEVVMSDDPELAPVGSLVRRMLEPAVPILQGMFPEASGFSTRVLELLAKGTPLRAAPFLELGSVDRNEIDPHRFDLPGPVMSAEEFDKAADTPAASGGSALPPLP
ncbi:hypothetical protein [Sphingomonas sp. dw_22]|uniref:hypothetical protein n=1 Tax=Sphingomonas sp. dw_22 TaxID=2721175 RepID=UPI001BD46F66|nr:hypothetical protein [Sphingomonas sp. dw_22]